MDSLKVAAILPCLGREHETLELIPRLRSSAGVKEWKLICISDGDHELQTKLARIWSPVYCTTEQVGYWKVLKLGTQEAGDVDLIVNLANDLLPGREWLIRATLAYYNRFGIGEGVIGFNDGVHAGAHAAHMLISRALLKRWFGDDYWPMAYQHNFGDTEIVARAQAEKLFAIAPFAVLYHNHPVTGHAMDDVYARSMKTWQQDQQVFEQRKKLWQ